MKLRRFSREGIDAFQRALEEVSAGSRSSAPVELLEDNSLTRLVTPEIEIEPKKFRTRLELGKYLVDVFAGRPVPNLDSDRGIWAWLALLYFDQLCPKDKAGNFRVGQIERLVPDDGRHYYRHLVRGPYQIYRAHRDNPTRTLAVLCNPPSAPGDIAEQLASSKNLIMNSAVMELATAMFIEPKTLTVRRGAASKGAGTARRLRAVLNQLDLTWDMFVMQADEIRSKLPAEFAKWGAAP